MAKPGLLVHHPADGFSLVPEALPALSQPVVFPPGHFNSCYKVSASPKVKGMRFRLERPEYKTPLSPTYLKTYNAGIS